MASDINSFKTRINSDLALLGTFDNVQQTTMIADAVTEFCRVVDPAISATLAVSPATKIYAIPSTIKKVEKVFSSLLAQKVFSIDSYNLKITFQNDCDTDNYLVFGQPKNIKTNLADVLAGLSEDYEGVIWQYVRAFAHKIGDSDRYISESQLARQMAIELIEDGNRSHGLSGQTIQLRDTQGTLTADAANAEGLNAGNSDFLGSMVY